VVTAETEQTRRSRLADVRRARAVTPEIEEEYAAARLRFELGEAVREQRTACGLSQDELGRRAGMTQSAVARFEAGGTVPTIPVLERLARALDLDLRVEFVPHPPHAESA
jgi:HTH-type transcriptional regulator/antitoxin HipB